MSATNTTNLIVPEILRTEVNVDFTRIFDMMFRGMADRQSVDAGEFVNIRGFRELSGDADKMVDGGSYNVNNLTTEKDIAVILHRLKKFGAEDLGMIVSGMDATAAIRAMIARYFAGEVTNRFIDVLTAIFGSGGPLNTTNLHDVYVDTATEGSKVKLTPDVATTGMALIGSNLFDLGIWMMHSAVYAYLVGQKHIVSVTNTSAFGGAPGTVETYLGKPIMVADHASMVTASSTPGNGSKYRTYLAGAGSLVLGVQKDINPEYSRTSDKLDVISTDMHFAAHVRGVKWSSATANPTNAQLSTATNWALIRASAKQVRLVAFDTNV